MFNFQLPLRRGVDLFPQEMHPLTVVRTNVFLSERYKLVGEGNINQIADEIVRFNSGAILNFYRSQRQMYDSGINQYQRTQRNMNGLSMNMSVVQGQEIVTLDLYPENFVKPPKEEEEAKCLMILYGENSIAAIKMSELNSLETMKTVYISQLNLKVDGDPVKLTPPNGLVYYCAIQRKFDADIGGIAVSNVVFVDGKLSLDYLYNPLYEWYLSYPTSPFVNAYNYGWPYAISFENEKFAFNQMYNDEWDVGGLYETWVFNWGNNKIYSPGGVYSVEKGAEQGGKYVIKRIESAYLQANNIRCISSDGTYYTGPVFYMPDYAYGAINFATNGPWQELMTGYGYFYIGPSPNGFGSYGETDLYVQAEEVRLQVEATYTEYDVETPGIVQDIFANAGYIATGIGTSEGKVATVKPICNRAWTDGYGVSYMDFPIPSATLQVPHAALNQTGGIDSVDIQFSEATVSMTQVDFAAPFPYAGGITLTIAGYSSSFTGSSSGLDPFTMMDTSSSMVNTSLGTYSFYKTYDGYNPDAITIRVGTPYGEYPEFSASEVDPGKGIGAPWLDLANGQHHIQSFIPHYQNADGDPYIKIYCDGQDITSRLETILGVQAKYIHGMLMDVPLSLIKRQ